MEEKRCAAVILLPQGLVYELRQHKVAYRINIPDHTRQQKGLGNKIFEVSL